MEAFVQLIREFGPIIIIYYLIFHAGPNWLKQMADLGISRARIQDAILESNAANVTRLLDQNEKERNRNSETEEAMREAIKFLSRRLDEVVEGLKNVAVQTNDIDDRMRAYARSTTESLQVIAAHILGSKSQGDPS